MAQKKHPSNTETKEGCFFLFPLAYVYIITPMHIYLIACSSLRFRQ